MRFNAVEFWIIVMVGVAPAHPPLNPTTHCNVDFVSITIHQHAFPFPLFPSFPLSPSLSLFLLAEHRADPSQLSPGS